MPRALPCWAAFLATASWAGIAAAEAGRFTPALPLLVGVLGVLVVAWATRSSDADRAPREAKAAAGEAAVLAIALVAAASLLPPVDTTLLGQDASIHRLAGRELARGGAIAVHDPLLDRLGPADRRDLLEFSTTGLLDVSRSRFPGGLVVPSDRSSEVIPSFAHLLSVWIAIADGLSGERAIGWLGPMFVATAWWAIGLLAWRRGGVPAAAAAIALLATWLPQHWFGRFLMPEVLTEALVWGGAALLAFAPGGGRCGDALAAVGGLCLGVACFARLEQLTIFLPAMLLARAVLPWDRALLPRAAWPWFALAAAHATAHLAIVPTDYGKRMSAVATGAVAHAWNLLGGEPRRVGLAASLLAVAAVAAVWALRRARSGLATRSVAGAAGALAFAAILAGTPPEGLPAARWLWWYVPWPAWLAAAVGAFPPTMPSGLGLALVFEGLDQVVSPRVTPEQAWGSRRLVTVVLPLVALAAARALSRDSRTRPGWPRRVVAGLIVLAVLLGASGLREVAMRRVQHGAASFAHEVDEALPPNAAVLVAGPLDWLHLAPVLWNAGARDVLVAAGRPGFAGAMARRLRLDADAGRPLFFLSGEVVDPGATVAPASLDGLLPPGWTTEAVRDFAFRTRMLERTTDRAPRALVPRVAEITLQRLVPPSAP